MPNFTNLATQDRYDAHKFLDASFISSIEAWNLIDKYYTEESNGLSGLKPALAAFKIAPEIPIVLINLGCAYFREKKYEEAEKFLNNIDNLKTSYTNDWALAYECLELQGKAELAEKIYSEADNWFEKNDALIQFYLSIAKVNSDNGKVNKAIESYLKALDLESNEIQLVNISINLAELYHKSKQFEEAYKNAQIAYEVLKGENDQKEKLAEIDEKINIILKDALSSDEITLDEISCIASILCDVNKYPSSIKFYNKGLAKDPNDKEGYNFNFKIADLYLTVENYHRSLQHLFDAKKNAIEDAKKDSLTEIVANIETKINSIFDIVISNDLDINSLYTIGVIFNNAGCKKQALSLFNKSLEFSYDEDTYFTIQNITNIYCDMGKIDESISFLDNQISKVNSSSISDALKELLIRKFEENKASVLDKFEENKESINFAGEGEGDVAGEYDVAVSGDSVKDYSEVS